MTWRTTRWEGYDPWPDRIYNRIIVEENDCWHLTPVHGNSISVRPILPDAQGRLHNAYVVIYELFRGRLPDRSKGEVLMLTCGDQFCVKPGHREWTTRTEEARQRTVRNLGHDPTEVCVRGHSRAEHGYRTPKGQLKCRVCETANRRAHREANRERERLTDRARRRRQAGWPEP